MAMPFDIPRLREQLRHLSFKPGQLKTAELGGGEDQPFEQAFSNLAHSYLRDKAPKLLDYEVGFQLIEKNQENTKAVGVFGFKLGNQWLYAPVFFLNGDLKGHELLYIKNQDSFVPLKENWLNYLLGRRPSVLGEGMNRNLSLVGVMPPNLYQLSRSPNKFAADLSAGSEAREHVEKKDFVQPGGHPKGETHTKGKYPIPDKAHARAAEGFCAMHHGSGSSECQAVQAKVHAKFGAQMPKMASWAWDALADLAYLALTDPAKDQKFANLKGVPELLKEAGEPLFRYLVEKVGSSCPAVLAAVDTLYGPDMLTGVARHIAAAKQPRAESILKQAARAMAGETPAGWNGNFQLPSATNGGIQTTGKEAWDSAQQGRRYVERYGGAHVGRLEDMQVKDANYPGCGGMRPSKPSRPRKTSRPAPVKRASIMEGFGKKAAPDVGMKPKKVKVVVLDEVTDKNRAEMLHDLDTDERARLLKERVVVKDNRDDERDVTLAFNVQTEIRLQNPDRTNIYRVLCKPDQFQDCLVLFGPYDSRGRNTFCTVISLEDKRWINIHPSMVWTESEYDDEAWRKWFDKLPELTEPPEKNDLYVILAERGQATCPCRVIETYGRDPLGTDVYDVSFSDYCDLDQPYYQLDYPRSVRPFREGRWRGSRIRLTHRPGKSIKVTDGDVCIPDGARYVELKKPQNVKPDGDNDADDADPDAGTEPGPLQLGNLVDLQLCLAQVTKKLKVYADGDDITFDEDRKLNKVGALKELILGYGLREKTARLVLEKAARERMFGRAFTVLLKQAGPGDPLGDMTAGAPNSPPFPEPNIGWDPMTGSNIPTMAESEFNVKVPDMSATRTDRSIYQPQGPDSRSMQVAQQAAQTGQREVFDTAMLGSLLKAVRQESMVDRYLGDLMKGMDRLGRILFLFYWHGEEFEERYGKQDMPELEDGLRNAFEGVGDVLLKLRQQTVDPYPDEGTDVDLSAIANQ